MTIYAGTSAVLSSKYTFFSASTFGLHRLFHNKKDRLAKVIEYMVRNCLLHEPSSKIRFIRGTHKSYALAPPNQIKKSPLSIEALSALQLTIDQYENLWDQCVLPSPELAAKIDRAAINHIKSHLADYVSIVHRLGDANDPIAREILRPGLSEGRIGIDSVSNIFSLAPEHIIHFETDNDIMKILQKLCIRATSDASVKVLSHHNAGQHLSLFQTTHDDASSNRYDQINTWSKKPPTTEESEFI